MVCFQKMLLPLLLLALDLTVWIKCVISQVGIHTLSVHLHNGGWKMSSVFVLVIINIISTRLKGITNS